MERTDQVVGNLQRILVQWYTFPCDVEDREAGGVELLC